MPERPWRPSSEQLETAEGESVPDVLAEDLHILFCGINPGLYSGAVGHHFARPGNRFWKALHAAGLTPKQFSPFEEEELLELDLGITNPVNRATASAAELDEEELRKGAEQLRVKAARYRPANVAVLGLSAYRTAFDDSSAGVGRQPERLADSELWLLPNTSGLNAHYQLDEFANLFRQLAR